MRKTQDNKQNMPKQWCALLLGLFAILLTNVTSSKPSAPRELFTSSFLVRFKRSVDSQLAHDIAKRNGFHNIGEVWFFNNSMSLILSHSNRPAIWILSHKPLRDVLHLNNLFMGFLSVGFIGIKVDLDERLISACVKFQM